MPSQPLRLALAQTRSIPGDVAANVAASVRTIIAARERGAALVAFPELSLTGYEPTLLAADPDLWLRPDDARLDPIRRACSDAGMVAVLGAPLRTADGRAHIAAPIIDATGALTLSLKQHVHGSEIEMFEPGAPAAPFTVAGWQVAVAICFDAAKPRHAEEAAARGADLYLASALYAVGEEHRADLHLGARAMDHRMFSALANHAGVTGPYRSFGGSGVWRPTGLALARLTDGEDLLVADLDPADLHAYR